MIRALANTAETKRIEYVKVSDGEVSCESGYADNQRVPSSPDPFASSTKGSAR
jgi:hypothetical protein